jgi:hypothetical protein
LKNIKRVWDEASPTFRSLGPLNMTLIDDFSFKYVSNIPFSYTLPLDFKFINRGQLLDQHPMAILEIIVGSTKHYRVCGIPPTWVDVAHNK